MKRHWLAVIALIAALGWVTPILKADNGKGKGKGNPHANESFDDDRGRGDRDDRWERRDG